MDPPLPTIDLGASLDDAFALLSGVRPPSYRSRRAAGGVVTKLDLLEYLAIGPGQ
jgi:hypothetical protein